LPTLAGFCAKTYRAETSWKASCVATPDNDSGQNIQTDHSRRLVEQSSQLVIKLEQELAELKGASGDATALVEQCEIMLAEIRCDLAISNKSLGKTSG